MKRVVAAWVGLVVVATGVWIGLRPAPPSRPPNVLIVVWDTVRADRMGVYGHDRPTTPFLSSFARSAVVYEDAIATSEWTAPTHASLFTGLPLQTHGVDARYRWLDDHHLTLAEHLGAQGYDTYAFTGNRFVSDTVNMLQGFSTVDHTYRGPWKQPSARATRRKAIPADRSTEISPAWQGDTEGWPKRLTLYKDAAPVANRALKRWLEDRPDPDRPFFAFLNVMEAHQPRIPTLRSRRALMDDATLTTALQTDTSLFALMAAMHGKRTYADDELHAIRATYDAAILDLDRAAAGLINGLDGMGLLDDTIVVFTSDHGEMLGENGLYSHRWALYQPLVHVPLIVRHPSREGARIRGPVTMAGLFATLCEWADVPVPDGVAAPLAPGRPVFTELRDPNRVMPMMLAAFPDLSADAFQRPLAAVLSGTDKLIRVGDHRHELYDLAADPLEAHDRFPTAPDPVELKAMLDDFDRRTPDYDPAGRTRADGRRPAAAPGTAEMLELLGYTEGEN